MKLHSATVLSLTALVATTAAYSALPSVSRSKFLSNAAATATSFAGLSLLPRPSFADDYQTTDSGMKYKVTAVGAGAVPSQGAVVKAHYTGWLDGFDGVKKFDSSRDSG